MTASAPAPRRPTEAAATKTITYNGLQLTIPARWPVIDGAHATHGCGSTFEGQTDRAFLGVSYHGYPSCPARLPQTVPPAADGVWMQPGPASPDGTATTLPRGQTVYLTADPHETVVTVWYRRVSIQIGIGADPTIEHTILNSIAYSPATANSEILGRCPTPGSNPLAMPTPTRVTATVVVALNSARIQPEPPNTSPGISAVTIWHSFIEQFGVTVPGALQWSIVYGSYSSPTPAHINPNGSTTPEFRDVPSWVIQAKGIETSYGPCGGTILAPYNANTEKSMNYLSTSG